MKYNQMKSPEEIKKGLECCKNGIPYRSTCANGCPYKCECSPSKTCASVMMNDALAYIQQLEAGLAEWGDVCASPGGYEDLARENNELLKKIEQLESTYSQVSKALCGKENATADEIISAFDQVKRERDAAVKDIESSQCCSVCEYCPDNEKCEANSLYCLDCTETDCKCKECNWGDKLKWRGVKEDNQ